MEPLNKRLFSVVLAFCFMSAAHSQDRQPDQTPSWSETFGSANGPSLTGKERSGRKWQDEQRIDNCNVPIDKRGRKPRPDCPHSPSG